MLIGKCTWKYQCPVATRQREHPGKLPPRQAEDPGYFLSNLNYNGVDLCIVCNLSDKFIFSLLCKISWSAEFIYRV